MQLPTWVSLSVGPQFRSAKTLEHYDSMGGEWEKRKPNRKKKRVTKIGLFVVDSSWLLIDRSIDHSMWTRLSLGFFPQIGRILPQCNERPVFLPKWPFSHMWPKYWLWMTRLVIDYDNAIFEILQVLHDMIWQNCIWCKKLQDISPNFMESDIEYLLYISSIK